MVILCLLRQLCGSDPSDYRRREEQQQECSNETVASLFRLWIRVTHLQDSKKQNATLIHHQTPFIFHESEARQNKPIEKAEENSELISRK